MAHKKTFIIVLIALLLSGIGVFFAHHYIETAIAGFKPVHVENKQKPKVEMVELAGTTTHLEAGEILTAKHFKSIQVPVPIANKHDYVFWQDINTIFGQRLTTPLPMTAAVRYSDTSELDYLVFSDQLNPGERAMTIPADAFNSIFGYLQPKDKIDLLLISDQDGQKNMIPLVQNIQILATDLLFQTDMTQVTLPNSGEINSITLRVSEQQAHRIALGQSLGDLVLLMRNKIDSTPKKSGQMKQNTIITKKKQVEIIVGGA